MYHIPLASCECYFEGFSTFSCSLLLHKALGGFDCIVQIPKSKWDIDLFRPRP